jgi:phage terminase large subunit-like protein
VQLETANADGHSVPITLEQEPGSSGKDSAADDIRALAGWVVSARPATGEKQVRWRPFAAQWQAGNVRIVRGDWNAAYLDEMHRAERSTYNDQVDASADAFRDLSTPGRLRVPWYPGAPQQPKRSLKEETPE